MREFFQRHTYCRRAALIACIIFFYGLALLWDLPQQLWKASRSWIAEANGEVRSMWRDCK